MPAPDVILQPNLHMYACMHMYVRIRSTPYGYRVGTNTHCHHSYFVRVTHRHLHTSTYKVLRIRTLGCVLGDGPSLLGPG